MSRALKSDESNPKQKTSKQKKQPIPDNVTNITEAKSLREKKAYKAKTKEIAKNKQESIEKLFKRLQNIELDDETMRLFATLNEVMWSLWETGRIKREYAGEAPTKILLKPNEADIAR